MIFFNQNNPVEDHDISDEDGDAEYGEFSDDDDGYDDENDDKLYEVFSPIIPDQYVSTWHRLDSVP